MDQEVYGDEVEEISWYERMEMYERNPHLLKQEHEVEDVREYNRTHIHLVKKVR